MKTVNQRTSEHPIHDLFLQRYSPRALSGESLTQEEILTLFEAGRWAPSSYNAQPWRFIYSTIGSETFPTFLDLLVDFNREWCQRASMLVIAVSQETDRDGKPAPTHSFDTGAAWENIALQTTSMGLVAHGMIGFDKERARVVANIPEGFAVNMMFAVGKKGDPMLLPESYHEREKPNDRKPLAEIVFNGHM